MLTKPKVQKIITQMSQSHSHQAINNHIDYNRSEYHEDCITIVHFNDCYNIEPSAQSSGAAGFLTAVNQYRHLNPMILFSGDIISPSFMSTFTKGEQMIPVLNDIGVDCAVFGNHEFDYGVDNLIDFVKRTTFPWLLSNVIDKETSNQLGDGQVFHIMERAGLKIGLIGLIEEEWLSTLSTLDSSDVIYQDFVTRGQELARWLKSDPHQVDYVIALTHFRTPNDIRLCDAVPEIDLILGGHDHDYEILKRPSGRYIIKSGTDFREFSKVTLKVNCDYLKWKSNNKFSQDTVNGDDDDASQAPAMSPFLGPPEIEQIKCFGYQPDETLKAKLDKFVTTIDEKMGKVLGEFNCDLDGRFASIRRSETNLGNFVTDIMLASTHADLAILNSGTLRSDRIHPRGNFTMRDLFNILGYIDPIAVLQASGRCIWRALENGVSQWPKLEGRFPQVSGCTFKFDPTKPPMQRIDPKDITIGDEPLDLDKHYRLTTKAYLAAGKDGYDMLKECKVLVPGDESPDLTASILNHFEAISIVKSNRRTHHRQSIICMSRSSLQKILGTQTPTIAHIAPVPDEELAAGAIALGDHHHHDHYLTSNAINSSDITHNHNHNDDNNNKNSETFGDDAWLSSTCSLQPNAPTASSPIAGTTAPTPTVKSLARATNGASPFDTPPSVIEQRKPTRTKRLMSLYEMEHEQCKMEPKVEGRIRIVGENA